MRPLTVAIIAVAGFSPFHLSVPFIVFSEKMAEKKHFHVIICAEKLGNVDSADGFSVTATHDYTAVIQADIVIIPYWGTITQKPPQKLLEALTTARDNGAQIVGLCLGTFVLGYAGLLKNKRAATHWEFEREFQARFPQTHLDINALYVDDDGIITSAGTAAALDCCLYIVRQLLAATMLTILPDGWSYRHIALAVRRSLLSNQCRKIPMMNALISCWITCGKTLRNSMISTRWRSE